MIIQRNAMVIWLIVIMLSACQPQTNYSQAVETPTPIRKEIVSVPEPLPLESKPKDYAASRIALPGEDDDTVVEYVPVGRPIPLPGQLKQVPLAHKVVNTSGVISSAKASTPASAQTVIRTANSQALQRPESSRFINSMMVYDYMDGALYQLHAAPGRVTDIMLATDERMITAAAGDTVRWVVQEVFSGQGDKARTHILIKPVRPGLKTNIFITTNLRTYHLEAHSYQNTYMASVKWNYPHDELRKMQVSETRRQVQQKESISLNSNIDDLFFGYKIISKRRNPDWRPERVFDDGTKTYIQFPAVMQKTEAPILFIQGEGKEKTQLVNYRIKNNYYIVDRLFDVAELRLGSHKPSIVLIKRKKMSR